MANTNSATWGENLTLVTASDFRYLPGVYALFNSAIMNGFKGNFNLLATEDLEQNLVCNHPRFSVIRYKNFDGKYHPTVSALKGLLLLPPGNYLYLDADIIIERPCDYLLEPINKGLLVSIDPDYNKYDPYDIVVYYQCKAVGLEPDSLPALLHINSGFLGFSLPRDQALIYEWAELSRIHLNGIDKFLLHPYFPFLDQDILNLLIRKNLSKGEKIFSISPKNIEFSNTNLFQERPFPYTEQSTFPTADRIKYIIHAAGQPRPWLQQDPGNSFKIRMLNLLKKYGIGALYRKRLPYERAWAYYTCSEDRPIPLSAWAKRHSFTAYKHWLWRKVYGLSW